MPSQQNKYSLRTSVYHARPPLKLCFFFAPKRRSFYQSKQTSPDEEILQRWRISGWLERWFCFGCWLFMTFNQTIFASISKLGSDLLLSLCHFIIEKTLMLFITFQKSKQNIWSALQAIN